MDGSSINLDMGNSDVIDSEKPLYRPCMLATIRNRSRNRRPLTKLGKIFIQDGLATNRFSAKKRRERIEPTNTTLESI